MIRSHILRLLQMKPEKSFALKKPRTEAKQDRRKADNRSGHTSFCLIMKRNLIGALFHGNRHHSADRSHFFLTHPLRLLYISNFRHTEPE